MLIIKASLLWFFLVICAIINGLIREKLLQRHFSRQVSLGVSGVLLCLWIFCLCYLAIGIFGAQYLWVFIGIGVYWVLLTLCFEFLFGHFVAKKSWDELLKVLDITSGDLFLLALLTTAVAPALTAVLHGSLLPL